MNDGKICVSVCAKTADELIEQIKRAEKLADVIEIRFDCLKNVESENLWRAINNSRKRFRGKLLAAFRPREQGGKRPLSFAEREEFWIHSHVFENVDWADLEPDFSPERIQKFWGNNLFSQVIKSFHDFENVPENLGEIFDRLSKNSEVAKIAVRAEDITDTIAVWKLLEKAKSENKQIIPIAMGESGKWTRILGLAHGAFMTYAALDTGSETAPGQISARDLTEVYRAKELNEETGIYGIVGGNTSYSMSPFIHNAAFKFHNLNSVFVPLQVGNLDEFMRRLVKTETREIELNFRGFAVTIPHKQEIVKHLDYVDETAREIGAVNTVKIEDGKLSGYNTDAHGFLEPLCNSFGDLKNARVAVFGAGGASRAVCCALKKAGAETTVFARNLEKAEKLKADFGVQIEKLSPAKSYSNFDILVNATPLGTKGESENETPAVAAQMENVKLVYDLIYNPFETKLIKEAKKKIVPTLGGLSMLVAQARAQQKIWTGIDAPLKEMSAAALRRLS
ncbi:MAG TPA: shikimate dehydrogenase [Pyrinomonadaceae bacterium]|jgi:3-dehydroquinate dehydratase/shikimate dehydrogenase